MVANIVLLQSALNFFMNKILIYYCHSQIFALRHISKGSISYLDGMIWPAFWWQDINANLVFSVSASRLATLLVSELLHFSLWPLCYLPINLFNVDQQLMISVYATKITACYLCVTTAGADIKYVASRSVRNRLQTVFQTHVITSK
jgi:hypothetical protein